MLLILDQDNFVGISHFYYIYYLRMKNFNRFLYIKVSVVEKKWNCPPYMCLSNKIYYLFSFIRCEWNIEASINQVYMNIRRLNY